MPKNFALRSARKGQGVLPPNPTRWEHEHNALDLRHELALPLNERLSVDAAFDLLNEVIGVLPHSALGMHEALKTHFSGTRSNHWSGMCIKCPDNDHLVVYNDSHPPARVRATLMEEFFHLWLGHPPSTIRVHSSGKGSRTFNESVESEAYGSGAAALVPYQSLKSMVSDGADNKEIADHFLVSEQLVNFRIKVSKIKAKRAKL